MSLAGVAILPGHRAPVPLEMPDAACADLPDPDLMHPPVGPGAPGKAQAMSELYAVAVCRRCPDRTRRTCLADAMAWPGEVSGVWGGRTERQINRAKRGESAVT